MGPKGRPGPFGGELKTESLPHPLVAERVNYWALKYLERSVELVKKRYAQRAHKDYEYLISHKVYKTLSNLPCRSPLSKFQGPRNINFSVFPRSLCLPKRVSPLFYLCSHLNTRSEGMMASITGYKQTSLPSQTARDLVIQSGCGIPCLALCFLTPPLISQTRPEKTTRSTELPRGQMPIETYGYRLDTPEISSD